MTRTLTRRFVTFLKNEEGVTAVECALLLAVVVVICLVTLAPASASPETPEPTVVLEADAN